MVHILIISLALQGQGIGGDTLMTQADAVAMVATVLDSVAPADGTVIGKPVAGRPLFIDVDQTALAFRDSLVPDFEGLRGLDRPFHASDRQSVVQCSEEEPSCEIRDDGIFVSVLSARSTDEAGVYLLEVRVRWTRYGPQYNSVEGYDMEMFLAKRDGRWEIIRRGTAVVV